METPAQRRVREQQRVLFDGVADRYDATRRLHPAAIADSVFANAAVGPGGVVLEIGCGTGQFTRHLTGRHLNVTAIDIGAAMVQTAQRNVTDATVRFHVGSFEDFPGAGPFDLIVSASAFHWIDPSVGLVKAARLLRPGGWLALLSTGERYPDPLQTRLRELWTTYSHQSGNWADRPAWLTALRESRLFGETVEATQTTTVRLEGALPGLIDDAITAATGGATIAAPLGRILAEVLAVTPVPAVAASVVGKAIPPLPALTELAKRISGQASAELLKRGERAAAARVNIEATQLYVRSGDPVAALASAQQGFHLTRGILASRPELRPQLGAARSAQAMAELNLGHPACRPPTRLSFKVSALACQRLG